ncbi:MAG: VIT1/CCC1 transporter family protein [Patescibacteria group bacterium]
MKVNKYPDSFAKGLIQDEMFDLTFYKKAKICAVPKTQNMLDELVAIETKHVDFWQTFFKLNINKLNPFKKLKLCFYLFIIKIIKDRAIYFLIEIIEVRGVRKYLAVWEKYQGTEMEPAVSHILDDEFKHEQMVLSSKAPDKQMDPRRIRDIFLGFNDGLVELVGAVSGFFAAFHDVTSVLVAGITVAIAGALSMAAGVYVSTNSELEVDNLVKRKKAFLEKKIYKDGKREFKSIRSALLVGICYLIGSSVPVLPVVFGARNVWYSITSAAIFIIFLSALLSFMSGMRLRERVFKNLFILIITIGVTYAIGMVARTLWGIQI